MRYAAGTKDVLDRFFNNKPLKKDDVIVEVSCFPCVPQLVVQLLALCSVVACSIQICGLGPFRSMLLWVSACQNAIGAVLLFVRCRPVKMHVVSVAMCVVLLPCNV